MIDALQSVNVCLYCHKLSSWLQRLSIFDWCFDCKYSWTHGGSRVADPPIGILFIAWLHSFALCGYIRPHHHSNCRCMFRHCTSNILFCHLSITCLVLTCHQCDMICGNSHDRLLKTFPTRALFSLFSHHIKS